MATFRVSNPCDPDRCFGYGQVESPYGSGEFYRELEEAFDDMPNLALSEIRNKEGIFDSIKEFLGRGR